MTDREPHKPGQSGAGRAYVARNPSTPRRPGSSDRALDGKDPGRRGSEVIRVTAVRARRSAPACAVDCFDEARLDIPMKLHAQACKQIIDALETGMTLKRAADLVGYSVKDVREAMRADPVFDAEVKQAGAGFEFGLLERITGATQWQAWKFLLQSLYPGRYYAARKRKPRPPQKPVKSRRERLAKVTSDELRALEPILKKIEDDDGPESGPADEFVRGGDGAERATPH